MQELFQEIRGLLQQILGALRNRQGGNTPTVSVPEPLKVQVINPTPVAQAVSVSNTPLPVNLTNTPISVNLTNTPIPVSLTDTPVPIQPPSRQLGYVAISANSNTTLVSGQSGKKIRVLAYALISTQDTATVRFRSGTSGSYLTGAMQFPRNFGIAHASDTGLFETATGQALVLETNQSVAGYLAYEVV